MNDYKYTRLNDRPQNNWLACCLCLGITAVATTLLVLLLNQTSSSPPPTTVPSSLCITSLHLEVMPDHTWADGSNYSRAVVSVHSGSTGMPLSGMTVNITSNHTGLTMVPRTGVSDENGTVFFNVRSIKTGDSTIQATSNCE